MSRLRRTRPLSPNPPLELPDVVAAAERVIYRESWQVHEEEAATRLASTRGVCWTRLFPLSPVLLVVAVDGQVVGRVRREGKRWHAVVPGAAKPVATRRTRRAAVVALARACAGSVGRADSAGCAETAEQPRRPGWWPLLVHQR